MVQKIALNHIRHVSDGAKRGGIIVAGTSDPRVSWVVLNVHLSGGVPEAHEPPGNDRDRVFLVVDVRYRCYSAVGTVHPVDVVGESGVADAWHAVADHPHVRASWQV